MPTFDTDVSAHRFPGIAKAALEMAFANGGVNRHRREVDVLKDLEGVLAFSGVDMAMDLTAISAWLDTLADDHLLVVADGEETEMQNLLVGAPAGTDELLNEIFHHAS